MFLPIREFSMSCVSYLVLFLISHLLLPSLAQEQRNSNQICPPFECGVLGRIGFPFSNKTHPECGLSLIVDNCNGSVPRIQLGKNGPWLFVTTISQDNTLTLHDKLPESAMPRSSCESFKNMTLPISPFTSVGAYYNPLFKCPSNTAIPEKYFSLECNETQYSIVFSKDPNHDHELSSPPNCSVIEFQTKKTRKGVELLNLYARWFRIQVNVTGECRDCDRRGGQCQFDDNGEFQCLESITAAGKKNIGLGLVLGITGIGVGMLTILAFCFRKKLRFVNSIIFWKKRTKNHQNIEVFIKNHGSLAPKRYSYSDIKKMTDSFKHKLGQGGFGGVYKGNLLDGHMVAVKVLEEAKSNGEEFINEVASISKTSHVNIVTLLGFCFEGDKRALIYEFVPNGSLEKFIYEKYSLETTQKLKWKTFYDIAVGIARGLEYLHRGCSTRILHFDIKPHNILLDEDFRPKISDFGLAKICPGKESIISMTGVRGTMGYIAPELFCRSFGDVSHKSDVYSYGMMVLEMVGARNKKTDVGVYLSSEIYFPYRIYNRLHLDEDLELQGIADEEDNECARKMIIVSLWCIQSNPLDRPTMGRVVDMLEGNIGSLEIPPKPYIYSPSQHCNSKMYKAK